MSLFGTKVLRDCRRCSFPLFVSSTGHADVVKLLVSRSADKSCKDKQGYTPLHAAAASGHLEIVKYLLRMGAEVRDGLSGTMRAVAGPSASDFWVAPVFLPSD